MNHNICFYKDDTTLLAHVVQFVSEGLEHNETVIIVATEEHRDGLKRILMEEQKIGLWTQNRRNYVTLDASTTLALFMLKGWPDEHLFMRTMSHVIDSVAGTTPVRIYGEMVAVLCAELNYLAAIQLERLWNKLAMRRTFSLLCGYPTSTFQGTDMALARREICACHSQIESSAA
jgi:hypothetical protein